MLSLKKRTSFTIIERRRWPAFLATIILVSAAVWGLQWGVLDLLHGIPAKAAFFVSTCVIGLAVVALYPTLLVLLRVITAEEAAGYPRPVRRLLGPILRLGGRASVKEM